MDKIIVSNLAVRNITGVDNWERTRRQPIALTITAFLDTRVAGDADALKCSVNYGTLSKRVLAFSEASNYRTVEALALGVMECLFGEFEAIAMLCVRVEKSKALLHADCAGVEVVRRRLPGGSLELVSEHPDLIFIKNLKVFAIVGLNPWEREEKQKVILQVTIYPEQDLKMLGDHVKPTHNYRTVSRVLVDFVEQSRYKTLEALVASCARKCIVSCHVAKICIRASKPSALLFAEAASVEITRSRADYQLDSIDTSGVLTGSGEQFAYLALGSNMGDRLSNIHRALDELQLNGCRIVDTSFLYETSPMYVEDQNLFLNAACKIVTTLTPHSLLTLCQQIEISVGRVKRFENGPREIDIDILMYGYNTVIHEPPVLVIPHPRIKERLFVLHPLADIAANVEHPTLHRTCGQLLEMALHRHTDLADGNKSDKVHQVCQVGGSLFRWNTQTFIMGILNVTPDSFSDGGDFFLDDSRDLAYDSSKLPSSENMPVVPVEFGQRLRFHIETLQKTGCNILDIGGYSTRPGAPDVSLHEELRRTIPIIHYIRHILKSQIIISIDTFRAHVAQEAIKCGANMINDVSGTCLDKDMASTIASSKVPHCLMHMRGTPQTMSSLSDYSDYRSLDESELIRGVRHELETVVQKVLQAGAYRWNIIVDPGIGFAKGAEQNLELMRNLEGVVPFSNRNKNFSRLPIIAGPSRKSFVGTLTGKTDPKDRLMGTAAACSACIAGGADILRVHDVSEISDIAKVSDSIWRTERMR